MEKNKASKGKKRNLKILLRKLVYKPKKVLGRYVKKDMKVLDIGCGPGMFSFEMALIGAKVISADLQQEMLDKLKNKIEGLTIEQNIKLVKCDEENINVNEKVDFALAFYVVNEVKNKAAFLGQIKKTLNKGGKLLLAEPLFGITEAEFKEILKIAQEQGFKFIESPKISLSRAALLGI